LTFINTWAELDKAQDRRDFAVQLFDLLR